MIKEPYLSRFFAKTRRDGECLVWKANYRPSFWLNGKTVVAARVAWEIATGQPPGALWVLHKCDNPTCVEPSHLFLGTPLANTRDMYDKGRDSPHNRHFTHCKRGHPLSGENLSAYSKRRVCKACMRLRWIPRKDRAAKGETS